MYYEDNNSQEDIDIAYRKGYITFYEGKNAEDNPYNSDALKDAWQDGYYDAMEEVEYPQVEYPQGEM